MHVDFESFLAVWMNWDQVRDVITLPKLLFTIVEGHSNLLAKLFPVVEFYLKN